MLRFALLVALALTPAPLVQDERLPELTDATVQSLFDAISPNADEESWRRLPWRTTFWQGVIDAQEAELPILLFTMNGHPFGCT
jgi:hypothetical protein